MSSGVGLRIRYRVTTALCCSLVSMLAVAAPARAADECGPVPPGGGTIECPTADYPGGINYDAGVEDLTVVVDPGSTLEGGFGLIGQADLGVDLSGVTVATAGDFESGVALDSAAGDVSIRASEVSTSGDGAAGIYSRAADGYTLIYSGNVATAGDGAAGLQVVSAGGDQVIVANFTTTSGEGSAGISAGSKSGDIFALAFGIDTSGDYSAGAQLDTDGGNITFQDGQEVIFSQIRTTGDHSDAVDLSTVGGNIESRTQSIVTEGDNSGGIHAVSGSGTVTIYNGFNDSAGTITTYGLGSTGIYARSGGDISITSDTIHTSGGSSDGIDAQSANGSVWISSSEIETIGRAIVADARYDVTIDSGSIIATGAGPYDFADAIHTVSGAGSIAITSGDLQTAFDRGIYGRADYGSITVKAGSIHTTGAGGQGVILLAGGDIDVTVDDLSTHSTAFLADGIVAYSGGSITITTGDVDVYGGHASAILGYAESGVQISANDVRLGYSSYWGPVAAGEAITGLSPYGDVSITAHNVYSQGRGIAGEALIGNIAISANNIVAGADAPYSGGLFASTFYGDVNVDVNNVTTHYGYGIVGEVHAEGDLNLGFGSVDTSGYLAIGVVVQGGGGDSSIAVSGDSIETHGDSSIGLFAFAYGTASNIEINTIKTSGPYSAGAIITDDFSYDSYTGEIFYGTTRFGAHSVNTLGDYSDGLTLISHAGDMYARVGEISTAGNRSAGLILVDSGAHLAPPAYGYGTFFFRPADFDIAVDSIETSGNYSTGITGYLQAGELHLDVGSLTTHGDSASGIILESGLVLFGNPGSEIFDIDVDHIETDGLASNGIVIYGNAGAVDIQVGNIVTHGADSSGLVALGLGDIRIEADSVDLSVASPSDATYYSTGVYAVSFGGNVAVDAGSVATGGDKSDGIIAASNGRVGYYGDLYVGNVSIAADQVSTSGDSAIGVAGTSVGGSVTIDVGTVETQGDYSIGVAANTLGFLPGYGAAEHPLYGGDLTLVADHVITHGDHSDGVSALGFSGGDTHVTVGTVETSGDDSYGVNVVTSGQANYYTGQFYGGSTNVTVDKVTTTGKDSNGVRVFAFTGDVGLTVGSIESSGENSDAVLALNGSNGSVVVNVLDQAISQQGYGVVASAYDDVDVNIAAGAHVFGGKVGIYASAYYDGASARITNLGEIASDGLAIVAVGQGITIDNRGAVTGPVSLTDHADAFDNSGTWQSFGASQFGFGDDLVLNTGRLVIGAGNAGDLTDWSGLETLDNRGLITMADGHADQVLNLERSELIGGDGSKLAIDIGTTATSLTSDLVELGIASGATELQLRGTGGLGRTLVVDANASSSAGNVFLPGGAADLGFVRMTLDYDAAKSNWSLVGAPDQEAFEGTRFGAEAQSLWRRGVDVWSRTMDEGPAPERFTLWGRYLTGHENQDLRPTFTALGVNSTPSLDTDASWNGAVLGASFGRGGWTWGALAGYTRQTTRFKFEDNKLTAKGAHFGAYAGWRGDKLFARAIANYQSVRAKADLTTAGARDMLHGSVAGLRGEAGLDLPLGAMRVQPLVSLSWTHGHLDDLRAPGATLDFHGFTSLEGSAGANFTGILRAGATTIHPYAGLYAVKEFKGGNALDLKVGGQSLRLVDQPRDNYAKATGGISADLGHGFGVSAGAEADFFGGRNAVKGQIGLNWHG